MSGGDGNHGILMGVCDFVVDSMLGSQVARPNVTQTVSILQIEPIWELF